MKIWSIFIWDFQKFTLGHDWLGPDWGTPGPYIRSLAYLSSHPSLMFFIGFIVTRDSATAFVSHSWISIKKSLKENRNVISAVLLVIEWADVENEDEVAILNRFQILFNKCLGGTGAIPTTWFETRSEVGVKNEEYYQSIAEKYWRQKLAPKYPGIKLVYVDE
jgi:hypothetical protein